MQKRSPCCLCSETTADVQVILQKHSIVLLFLVHASFGETFFNDWRSMRHLFQGLKLFCIRLSNSRQSISTSATPPTSPFSQRMEDQEVKAEYPYWISTPYFTELWSKRQSTPKGCLEFGFMSWNILSQDLIDTHRYLYSKCNFFDLNWESRWERLKIGLSQPHLNIICLQEVNAYHYSQFIKPFMDGLGFYSLYKKRGGDKRDGCALFYNPRTFVLEDSIKLDFNQDNVCDEQKRDNVAIIARFKPREESRGRRLVVATTHLLYNPKRGDIKLTQLRILLAEIKRMATQSRTSHSSSTSRSPFYSIILAGDFNSKPNSLLYNFLVNGSIDPLGRGRGELSGQLCNDSGRTIMPKDLMIKGIDVKCSLSPCKTPNGLSNGSPSNASEPQDDYQSSSSVQSPISHDLELVSVLPILNPTLNHPFVSTCVMGEPSLVDYVFYMSSIKLICLSYQALPTDSYLVGRQWLPNQGLPSDHFPLQVMFLLASWL